MNATAPVEAEAEVEQVPAWYRLQQSLMRNPLTRPILFNWHRARKKMFAFRENRMKRTYPHLLMNFERKVFSQNGEDGVIAEIFRRIGVTNKLFVEFGVQDGRENCTRNLLENEGWSGVWMEGAEEGAREANRLFGHLPIRVLPRFVTIENLFDSFEEAGIPIEFDLLSIDADGNDYWFWKKAAERYKPRVVIMEYNATFGPTENWIKPYSPDFRNDGTAYFGATLQAYDKLAREVGYRLVGCESAGVNAFFVRADLATTEAFPYLDRPVSFHYVGPHYDSYFGHPVIPELAN